ncbi:MAG: hypothetical protein Q8O00_15100, partial [Holophaga sp.]|nr:hypothetical protein [Holophaga sp.]
GTNAQGILAKTIVGLRSLDYTNASLYPSGVTVDFTTRPWDHAATITSPIAAGDTNDMVFDATGSVVRQTVASGNAVVQKFDLVLRFLGERGGGGAGDPTGGTNPKAKGTLDLLWQVTSRGSANIPSSGISFTQSREALGIQSRSQD